MPAAVCFICAAFSDFICNHNLSYHRYAEDLLLLYHSRSTCSLHLRNVDQVHRYMPQSTATAQCCECNGYVTLQAAAAA